MTVELVPLRQSRGRRALSIRERTCVFGGTIMTLVNYGYETAPSASATRSILVVRQPVLPNDSLATPYFPALWGPRSCSFVSSLFVCVRTGVGQTSTVSGPSLTRQVPDPWCCGGLGRRRRRRPAAPSLLVCPPPLRRRSY